MKEDYETEEKKQAAADVMFQYSKFVMACIGNQVRPSDLRLHLMKEISGFPTSLKKESMSRVAASPDAAMGESSSSGKRYLVWSEVKKPAGRLYRDVRAALSIVDLVDSAKFFWALPIQELALNCPLLEQMQGIQDSNVV